MTVDWRPRGLMREIN